MDSFLSFTVSVLFAQKKVPVELLFSMGITTFFIIKTGFK